jgi:hypothetical protein
MGHDRERACEERVEQLGRLVLGDRQQVLRGGEAWLATLDGRTEIPDVGLACTSPSWRARREMARSGVIVVVRRVISRERSLPSSPFSATDGRLLGAISLSTERGGRDLATGCGTRRLRPAGDFAQAVAEFPVARQSVDRHHHRVPHGAAKQVDVQPN